MEHNEQMLRELLIEITKKHHYENCTVQLKAISSGGANYTSDLYTATVSSPNKEELQLFAKVAAINKEFREIIPEGLFDVEYLIYSELAEKYKTIENKFEVPEKDRFTFCKYYGHNQNVYEETIVLENLAAKGFIVYDRMKSVDWPYASKAVETLAKFHALSMAYGEQYPDECEKITEKFDKLKPLFDNMVDIMKAMIKVAIKETKEHNKERLSNFLNREENLDFLFYTTPRRKAILIHGDYRPSNIMHRENEDGTIELIPLDFQGVRPGCVVSDLLYFIFLSTDQEFRSQYYEKLVELYYQQLCRSLRALHYDPEKVYSREDFESELKEILPYGLVCSVMLLPVITVKPEDAPDIHDDNLFENMGKTKTSSVYPERMNGVVDDYVRWGII